METPLGRVGVYCVHLEVYCGVIERIKQFSEVLEDSRKKAKEDTTKQIILGDLNTSSTPTQFLYQTFQTLFFFVRKGWHTE